VFIGLLWVVASYLPRLTVLWFGAAVLVLAVPATMALWYQAVVTKLIELQQFRSDSVLYWLRSRRTLALLWRGLVALLLSAAFLFQSVFFKRWEWWLLALAPALYWVVFRVVEARSKLQFSHVVFRQRWSFRFAAFLTTLTLALVWWVFARSPAQEGTPQVLDRVHELQAAWLLSPSATVRWALDALAWGQAALESAETLPNSWWKSALFFVMAPLSMFYFVGLSIAGLSMPAKELRRVFSPHLTAGDPASSVGVGQAAVLAAIGTVVVIAFFQTIAYLEHRFRAADSPLATKEVPCERIDGKVYALNTTAALTSLFGEVQTRLAGHQANACSAIAAIEADAAQGVDAYLDWYFSLTAEWLRLAALLSGDVDVLLEAKFAQLVLGGPDLATRVASVRKAFESQWVEVLEAQVRSLGILGNNSLVLDERSCKVVKDSSMKPLSLNLEESKIRLRGAAGSGLITGALAAQVTAEAMSQLSMKTASKVLAKVATKKVLGKAASAAAGAAVGAAAGSVVPMFGTAIGAGVGAVVGLVTSASVDMTLLMLEEKVTRDDMRKELLAAVRQSLLPSHAAFACSATEVAGTAKK